MVIILMGIEDVSDIFLQHHNNPVVHLESKKTFHDCTMYLGRAITKVLIAIKNRFFVKDIYICG
jgi:hypothetical protein